MEKRLDIDGLKEVYKVKAEYFHEMAQFLLTCGLLINLPPEVEYEFPPKEEAHKLCKEWLDELQVKEEQFTDLDTEEDGEDTWDADMLEFYKDGNRQLKETEVMDRRSFGKVGVCCAFVRDLYNAAATCDFFTLNHLVMHQMDARGFSALAKASELIGYWTAKVEEKKRLSERGKKLASSATLLKVYIDFRI